uniref:Rab-GAP TBC domain-containing protein n=1 Tax=Tanacetum cinerariifolium TaxID=118510 RepID=A0A6L2JYS3_TANCI|nr:hypothetical protein [Tanacetum cinerariifolium]
MRLFPWSGDDSLDDMSMMLVLATFLGGFLVEKEALEAIFRCEQGGIRAKSFKFLIDEEDGFSGLRRFFRYAMFIYSFYLCYSLSLYPFTERYAQPYFFSCLIRQTFRTVCLLNYALMIHHDYDIRSSLRRGALQLWLSEPEIREEFRTSSGPLDAGGNPPPVTIHTWLEPFNKQNPHSFEKATAPVDAENWISHMEKIFDVMGCEDAFKTRLAVYKFEVFPRAEQERLKKEYHSIRQTNTETITEFMQRFLRLAGFLGAAAGTEEEQAKNFQWGPSKKRTTIIKPNHVYYYHQKMKNNNTNGNQQQDPTTNSHITTLDSRFNQTLRNVQGLLKGRSFPGKVLITRRSDPLDGAILGSPGVSRSPSEIDSPPSKDMDDPNEDQAHRNKPDTSTSVSKSKPSMSHPEDRSKEAPRFVMGARATDTARLMKFTKVLGGTTVILDKLRELAWSGVPPYLRPNVWRLLLGYAPPNSDRREGVLRRKRIEYFDCVAQYYDISDNERTDEEITMLRQIAVDCPRTVPDVTFFQQSGVQKSLERILYTWAIRHPASGYVQGINDLATPFLVVFLSEHLEGSIDSWSIADLAPEKISDVEADCYWCLSKLLDGMQDHYTFAQPGIQRLVFKLKELVRRIDEPVAKHMDEHGLEFLQFAFRWFNCLLIREIPFHLVTRLWDTYLAEGDALPDFLVYIFASFLLTWSDKLLKLDFQEMVMFLQHLPTNNWGDQELEMVLSRAFMWHTMFDSCPNHLAT